MEAQPKTGIDKLQFGMKREDVSGMYGKADKQFKDEDGNDVWLYNQHKLRLTFYADENFRLGYIIASLPDLSFMNNSLIGRPIDEIKAELKPKGFKSWDIEEFDSAEHHFNEDNWTIIQSEFGEVVKLELGADIQNDEFVWKFK